MSFLGARRWLSLRHWLRRRYSPYRSPSGALAQTSTNSQNPAIARCRGWRLREFQRQDVTGEAQRRVERRRTLRSTVGDGSIAQFDDAPDVVTRVERQHLEEHRSALYARRTIRQKPQHQRLDLASSGLPSSSTIFDMILAPNRSRSNLRTLAQPCLQRGQRTVPTAQIRKPLVVRSSFAATRS
jgi:hypothetical protein